MLFITVERTSIASISVLVFVLLCFGLSRDTVSHGFQGSTNVGTNIAGGSQRHAAVYAGRQFHDEVASSIACLLHDMQFVVTVYYYAEIVVSGFSIPVGDNRLFNSKAHFGRCVDYWVSITPFTTLTHGFNILVYVSYPMKMDHHSVDAAAHSLVKQIHTRNLDTKVVLITHQAKENIWKHARSIEQYIPRDQLVFLFLSRHTYQTAVQLQNKLGLAYDLSYFYPTVPLRLLFPQDMSTEIGLNPMYSANTSQPLTFAIQGHFGGAHAKRRNVTSTLACLHNISKHTNILKDTVATSKMARSSEQNLELNLVGRISGDVTFAAPSNSSVQVTTTGELTSLEFYRKIASSHYLVTSLGSDLYMHRQATSTIPTALILHIPVVTAEQLLRLYPCLWEAAVHRRFTQTTECETIQHVMRLSQQEYLRAKEEVANCSAVYWAEAKQTMNSILQVKP